jgi:hypothetical protein
METKCEGISSILKKNKRSITVLERAKANKENVSLEQSNCMN